MESDPISSNAHFINSSASTCFFGINFTKFKITDAGTFSAGEEVDVEFTPKREEKKLVLVC